ncbi:hypothetical protein Ppa06_69450 [Planomonospora parontospora subsp. parontospora]|uniref:STAS domain-containing protein n=2 Tax=Planomonospora parontospora TaxID=58119 RepID=A0AA37BM59_9ACTN|nr:STAS domain-containing protein [Planomonospora parontospora]GGK91988.1 hypothetical protein GCM10010126_59190 [Planomonospora parontospora]GII13147.1 hypothetical protein Ppa06_69450 [Planomonospora parontospora subsp. parontospora]
MTGSADGPHPPHETVSQGGAPFRDGERRTADQQVPASPGRDFTVKLLLDGPYAILVLEGRLERSGVALLQEKFTRALVARHPPWLIIEVAGLESADSFGLAVLLGAERHARTSGGRMIVCGAGDILRTRLARRGLEGAFEMRATVGEAITDLYLGR